MGQYESCHEALCARTKEFELDLTAREEGSALKLPYLELFIGWGVEDGWQAYQLGSFCSMMGGK